MSTSAQASKGVTVVATGPTPAAPPAPPLPHAPTHAPASGSDPLATGPAGTIQIGDASATGVADTLARADHVHAVPAPTNVSNSNIGNAPNLGASPAIAREDHAHGVPAPTVVSNTLIGNVADLGTSGAAAREDHIHAMAAPALPAAQVVGAGAAGVDTAAARADHVHPMALTAFPAAPVQGFRLEPLAGVPLTDTGPLQFVFLVGVNGDAITMRTAAGLLYNLRSPSLTIDLATAPIPAAGTPQDVFVRDVAGVLTIVRRAWASPVARAVGLQRLDGLIVDTAVDTDRYVGSIYGGAGGNPARTRVAPYPAAGVPAQFGIWNADNRRRQGWSVRQSFASWVQGAPFATWRGAAGSSATSVQLLQGIAEGFSLGAGQCPTLSARLNVTSDNTASARAAAIGYDTLAAVHPQCRYAFAMSSPHEDGSAELEIVPDNGVHFVAWIEIAQGPGSPTWYGELADNYSNGMSGVWEW